MTGRNKPGRVARSLVVAFALSAGACSSSFWNGVAQGMAAAGNPGAAYQNASNGAAAPGFVKLMLFGGEGHKTYLGCLNCSETAPDSIFNKYGPHGNQYQTESLFNHYGEFGSRYSLYSACNPYASDPPVIVDPNGAFYGRLTVNANHAQITRNERWLAWIAGVCTDH